MHTLSLPFNICQMNLDYVIAKNHEIAVTSNMMLCIFLFVTYSLYGFYNNHLNKLRIKKSELTTTIMYYKELVELMNNTDEVFDFIEMDINDPETLIEHYNDNVNVNVNVNVNDDETASTMNEDSNEETEDSNEETEDSNEEEEEPIPRPPPTPHPRPTRPNRILRSQSRKEEEYRFDRDYNVELKSNTRNTSTRPLYTSPLSQTPSTNSPRKRRLNHSSSHLGISGKNWHLD
jgi:hypothetical protein